MKIENSIFYFKITDSSPEGSMLLSHFSLPEQVTIYLFWKEPRSKERKTGGKEKGRSSHRALMR